MIRTTATTTWMGAALALALCSPLPVAAESAAARFAAEAKRLEGEIAAARRAWEEQYRLYDELLAAAQRLERGFADADATAAELRALEDRYSAALDAAYRQALRTSESRRRVYDGMDRLAEAGRGVDEERRAPLELPLPAGLWSIEVPGAGLTGLMRLELSGALVRGDYRLSNGRHGSMTGTYAAGRLELVRVDSQGGRDTSLMAEVHERDGTFAGTWQRFDLASGGPSMGSWTGVRLGPGDEVPELDAD